MMDAAFLGTLTASGFADADVNAWIAAVQAADQQALELEVRDAMNTLVTGIKADGDWTGIHTLVVLNAARTLNGMAIAVKGTNVGTLTNIIAGDLVRGRGLTGNGVNKWGDTNVPQNAYGSTTSGWVGAHISSWTQNSPNTVGQNALGVKAGSDFTRIGIGGTVASPTSGDSVLSTRMWSSATLFTLRIFGSGFGTEVVMSVARAGGNLTARTYPPTPALTRTEANTATAPSPDTNIFLAGTTVPNQPLNGSLASYVMSNGGAANADRVMPRLVTFTNSLRAFFGN